MAIERSFLIYYEKYIDWLDLFSYSLSVNIYFLQPVHQWHYNKSRIKSKMSNMNNTY